MSQEGYQASKQVKSVTTAGDYSVKWWFHSNSMDGEYVHIATNGQLLPLEVLGLVNEKGLSTYADRMCQQMRVSPSLSSSMR